ncbi:MAG: hydrogenase iron-sulfur subunit [Candidatus Korarchaeota archaeon]|nr:hydrogenase iron-sulfur subunit [Candidatus Korarchaeota archaeon]
MNEGRFEPLVLVFSTNSISDPGIDFAGLLHLHYPTRTVIVRLPCSSIVRPQFVLYALTHGFDGVFIAADGPDCPYLAAACVDITSQRMAEAQNLLKENGIKPERLAMAGICSVCAEPFVKSIKAFYNRIKDLGKVKVGEV